MHWTGGKRQRTVSHSKNNASFLHRSLDLETMFDRSGHRFLAQYIVSLRSEGLDKFRVHTVMDSNDNGVRETLSGRLDALRRSFMKLLPSSKHETAVEVISIYE